jgi:CubicO group peptidase (beta-lactamase class C family)
VIAALDAVADWPGTAAAGCLQPGGDLSVSGPSSRTFAWASVTKILTSMCIWIAAEEGTVAWDDPAGPDGATLADLLSHASGLAPDGDRVLAPPRRRRIYSNRGIELAAGHLAARADMPFGDYLAYGLIEPLGMTSTVLQGSPAHGASGPVEDLLKLAGQLLEPTLFSSQTLALATEVATPGLAGVLPGFGRQDPNDWGLGVEIRDHKRPHWTGGGNTAGAFGHFGQAGGFLWVDPGLGLALAALGSTPFGPWATEAWPALSDAVIDEVLRSREGPPAP